MPHVRRSILAAAQQILVSPEKLRQGAVVLEMIPGAPPVEVLAREVVAVDKIGDIYAHAGTGREIKVAGNTAFL